jgi:hypothetical protein
MFKGAQAHYAAVSNKGGTAAPVHKGRMMAEFTVAGVESLTAMHDVKWCAYTRNFMSNDSFSAEQRRARPENRYCITFSNSAVRAKATPAVEISVNRFRYLNARGILVADLPAEHLVATQRRPAMKRGDPTQKPPSTTDGKRALHPAPKRVSSSQASLVSARRACKR